MLAVFAAAIVVVAVVAAASISVVSNGASCYAMDWWRNTLLLV